MINIKGLNKSDVLLTLWRGSISQGLAVFGLSKGWGEPTRDELDRASSGNVDYFKGRVIKCDLRDDEFDPRLYDRDCGEGAAQRAIASLKDSG